MDPAVVATAAAAATAQASRVCGGDAESPTGQTGAPRARPNRAGISTQNASPRAQRCARCARLVRHRTDCTRTDLTSPRRHSHPTKPGHIDDGWRRDQGGVVVKREDVEFAVEGDVTLRGWLFVPEGPGPRPSITMAHGYAGVREHGLERFARVFAEAGFVVLVHDHRGFGHSDGEPRFDIDPWRQIADWRWAISYLENRPEVDPHRIGLWGTSYAGGHAIVLGATDRRLRAVVAQVPTISGFEQGLRRVAPDRIAALERAFAEDDRGQLRGEPLRRQLVVSDDLAIPASYHNKDAIDFYLQPTPPGIWENSV